MNLWPLILSIFSSFTTPASSAKHVDVQMPQKDIASKVVILMSTDRPESQTNRACENLLAAYQQAGISAELFKVTDFGAEFYAPTAYAIKPQAFTAFNNAVLAADMIILVTPEYNATIPAPLTRVINLLSYPDSFENKKFVIVSLSVSPWAASRAQEQLKKTLTDLHAIVQDDLMLKIAEVQNATKGSRIYTEHAAKMADFLQK